MTNENQNIELRALLETRINIWLLVRVIGWKSIVLFRKFNQRRVIPTPLLIQWPEMFRMAPASICEVESFGKFLSDMKR